MDTIEKKTSLTKRFLAFFASVAVLAGGVVAGAQADTAGKVTVTSDQPGAQLQILDASGSVVIDGIVTDGQPQTFTLEAGEGYRLHEVAPPTGYKLAQDVTFPVLPSETTSTQVIQPARQLPTSVSAYNDGLPTTGAYHTNDGMFVFCVDASDEYPPRGNYNAQQLNGVNGVSRDQLLRILYVGFVGNAKGYGEQFRAAEDYDARTQFWMGTQYAVTSYTNPSLAEEYFGKYLGPNKSLANQIKAAANDTSIVVPDGSVAYLYQSPGNQPFVAASFPVVRQETTYGQPTQVSINHVKDTTPPPPTPGDGEVVIKKTDDKGNVLTGAKFQIVNANGQVVKEFTSTGNDKFTLAPGKYTLIETQAPKGYEIQGDGKYPFEIKAGTTGVVAPGDTATVVASGTTGGSIFVGTGHMEVAGGLAFCVNPQAVFLWEGNGGNTYSYSVLGENQVDLAAFGIKNSAGARGWIAGAPSNIGLNTAKMEQVKKVLWATYDYAMTGSSSKDYSGIIAANIGTVNDKFKQAAVYQATQAAIAELVSPGSVNWNALGNNHTTGNVKTLALALVAAAQGQSGYFAAYGGYSIVYLQSSDPSTQNLVIPGSEKVELVVVNTEEEEIEENPNSDSYYPTLNIEAKKSLEGGDINSNQYKSAFEFTLTGSNGAPMPAITTVKNNGEKVSFGTVEFKKAGTFTYTIKETKGNLDGVTYDTSSQTVEVTVKEEKFGNDKYLVISEVKVNGTRVNADVSYGNFPSLPDAPQSAYGQSNSNYGSYYGSSFFIQSGGTTHTAFCLDFSKDYPRNANYSLIANPSDVERNADMLKKIAYFGYPYDGSGQLASYVRQVNNTGLSDEVVFRYATNVAIWKTLGQSLPTSSDAFSTAVHSIANKIISIANANSIPSNVQVAMHVYSSGSANLQRLITFDAVKKPQHVKVTAATPFKNTIKPEIGTTATDQADGDHAVIAGRVTIVDKVHYKHLIPGREYTIEGTLYDKATGKALTVEGATKTEKFTASATGEGDVYMKFSIDASTLAGKTLVAFETVSYEGTEVAVHADINDVDQSVKVKDTPEIGTLATAGGKKIVEAKGEVTITDLVGYKNLQAGKTYTLKGKLIKKSDESVLVENSTTFKAVEGDGTVTLDFVIPDASVLKGESVVVFEEVYDGDTRVAVHTDLADEKQTVTFPEIGTTATDQADGDHFVPAGTVTIVDEIKYTNLIPGKTYTVSGTLYDKETGKALTVDGATASKTFTAETPNGSVKLEFTIDASALAGKAIVAFEDVAYEGTTVAVHADINDEDQTVYVPEIGTTATADGKKIANADGEVVIKDVVSYKGLKPGVEYTLSGKLVTKSSNGETVVAENSRTFTASDSGEGTVELEFTVDASTLAGDSVVAFETVSYEGKTVAVHADINDEGQTVTFPEIKTNAHAEGDLENNVIKPIKTATVVDTVTYTNLIVGKEYTVSGKLMVKETGKALLVNGEEVTASTTFTAEKANGTVDIVFTFDASALEGKKLVAFETVSYEGVTIAVHADINDEDQTVEISEKPVIGTTATNGEGGKEVESDKEVVVVDTVAYSNLEPGETYTLKGTLVKKSDGTAVATGEATFVAAEGGKGMATMEFTFDASALGGDSVVAFEYLFLGDVTGKDVTEKSDEYVTKHEDIDDEGQTVYVKEKPEIEKYVNKNVHKEIDLSEVFTYDVLAYITKDADKAVITDTLNDDLQFVSAVGDVTVVDLGAENNHKPYGTVAEAGTAVESATVAIDGQTLTVTIDPATAERGHWVKVTFDAKIADGKTIADLKYATVEKNDPVLTDEQHEGVSNDASYKIYVGNEGKYSDESNTVTVKPAKIGTNATGKSTQEHLVYAGSEVTVVDVVAYEGLKAGETYTLKGTLVKKSDGTAVATGEATFVAAEGGKGMATMEFTFDASALGGDKVVAFEYLYCGDVTGKDVTEESDEYVTKHEDINDEGQTVDVVEEKPAIEKYVNKNVHKEILLDEVFTYDVLAYVTKDADKVVITDTLVDDLQFVSTAKDVTVVDLGTENDHKPYGTVAKDGTPVKAEAVIDGQTLTVTIDPATAERGHWVKMTFDAKIKDGLQITDLDYAEITENNPVLTDEVHEGVPNKASYEIFVDNKGKYALESNTVTVKPQERKDEEKVVELGTTATDNADGDKELAVNSNVTVKDVVEYKNLMPNQTYTLKGQLVVKGTDGKDIVATGEATFTADKSGNGTVDMFFNLNTAGLDGKELVVYEYLFLGDVVGQNIDLSTVTKDSDVRFQAKHADDNDQGQTVKVAKKPEETVPPTVTPTPARSVVPTVPVRPVVKLPVTGLPKTGSPIAVGAMAAFMLIGGGLVLVRRRNG